MKYLLDTDIIVNHIRKKKIIEEEFIEEGASINIITLAELLYGANKSDNPTKSLQFLERTVNILRLEIVNLDEQTVAEFGVIKAGLERKGMRLDDFDLLIAATAKVNNLILITENKRHFERIEGLNLSD